MKLSPRLLTLAILLTTACSNGPDTSDASVDSGKDVVVKDVSQPPQDAQPDVAQPPTVTLDCTEPPEAGTGDAGSDAAIVDAALDADLDAGLDADLDAGLDANIEAGLDASSSDAGSGDAGSTKGSCIVINPDAGVLCNPVTNQGCDFADAGEACDFTQNAGQFQCYTAPPNTAAICTACDYQNGPACRPGLTCVDLGNGTTNCGRWCCVDSDCGGTGHCDTTYDPPVGICVQ